MAALINVMDFLHHKKVEINWANVYVSWTSSVLLTSLQKPDCVFSRFYFLSLSEYGSSHPRKN